MHNLSALFEPRSVAVIGASSDPDRIGGRLLRFLIEAKFEGAIYPVNKSGTGEIQGLKAYGSVRDVPSGLDQAVIVIPVSGVESALRDSIEKGVKSVIVLTSGFAEVGSHGRALQDRLVQMCRDAGVRMLGPNSLGLINVETRFFATFSTALYGLKLNFGPISLATQSGAFGSAAYGMATLRGLGFNKIIATGNEADVDVAECIDYLAEDSNTGVICAALESCREGQRLRAALLKAAHAGKPVIVMKVGRTELGAAAATTHTGSLAGNDAAYDAVFAECGAYRASSIEEMLDIAYFCSVTERLPDNPHVGVLTSSGGIGVLMADEAGAWGLTMPPLSEAGSRAALDLLPFAIASNPLDVTAQVTSVKDGVARALDVMLSHGTYGTVFAYLAHVGLSSAGFEANYKQSLIELRSRHPHKNIVLVMLSLPEVDRQIEAIGIPVFADPSRAVAAVAGAANIVARRLQLYTIAPQLKGAARLGDVSTEALAKRALAEAGLSVPPEHLCRDITAAVTAAQEVGFPVVAKISSPDITHKTEIGGVMLNLADSEAVSDAFVTLLDRACRAEPNAHIDGVLIAPMLKGGVETIIGIHMDPTFGPLVMYGSGGTAVELYRDVAFASAPLTKARAEQLVDKVRSSVLLRGWRGTPALDEAALVDTLCKLSEFAMTYASEIESVDINPLVVRVNGAVCLDAVIARRARPA